MKYLQLIPNVEPPVLDIKIPFKAVIILEESSTPDWKETVSDWLVHVGCMYMMAWGKECSSWDDSLDLANLKKFNYEDIPDDHFVMTTWHDNQSLEDVFWFAKYSAFHPTVELKDTLLVHISRDCKKEEILGKYKVI